MKLYEVPRNTIVQPQGGYNPCLFHHVDGMYSYCTDEGGAVYHLAAWTEVDVVTDVTVLDRFKDVV